MDKQRDTLKVARKTAAETGELGYEFHRSRARCAHDQRLIEDARLTRKVKSGRPIPRLAR